MRSRVVEVVVIVIAVALIGLAMRPRPEPAPPPPVAAKADAQVPAAGSDDAMALIAVMGVVQIVRATLPEIPTVERPSREVSIDGVRLGMEDKEVHLVLGRDFETVSNPYAYLGERWGSGLNETIVYYSHGRPALVQMVKGSRVFVDGKQVHTLEQITEALGSPAPKGGLATYRIDRGWLYVDHAKHSNIIERARITTD